MVTRKISLIFCFAFILTLGNTYGQATSASLVPVSTPQSFSSASHLLQFYKEPSTAWQAFNLSSQAGALLADDPVFWLNGNSVSLFAPNIDGRLQQFYKEPSTLWQTFDITSLANTAIAGKPTLFDNGTAVSLFVRDTANHLRQFYKEPTSAWQAFDISAQTNTNIVGSVAVSGSASAISIFARDTNNHLQQFYKEPTSAWQVFDLSTAVGVSIAGDPVAFVNGTALSIFARDSNNHLQQFYKEPTSPWRAFDLSAEAGVAVEGNPSFWFNGTTLSIFIRGQSVQTAPKPISSPSISGEFPYFWQGDPKWANDSMKSCPAPCDKVGPCGCALTSVAMVFKQYGTDTDPNILNTCMGNKACGFDWITGAKTCSNGKAEWVEGDKFSWSQLDQELNQNRRPVILGMSKSCKNNNGIPCTHFIVVYKGSGNNPDSYLVNDPGQEGGAAKRLAWFSARGWSFNNIQVYKNLSLATGKSSLTENLASLGFQSSLEKTNASSISTGDNVQVYRTTNLTMTVKLNAPTSTDMLIWTDAISNTTWQPYAQFVSIPTSNLVFVKFRDSLGNVSDTFSAASDLSVYVPTQLTDNQKVFLPLVRR